MYLYNNGSIISHIPLPMRWADSANSNQFSSHPMLENGDSMDSMAMESMGNRTIKPKTELPTKPRVFIASPACGALQSILFETLFVVVGLDNDFVTCVSTSRPEHFCLRNTIHHEQSKKAPARDGRYVEKSPRRRRPME